LGVAALVAAALLTVALLTVVLVLTLVPGARRSGTLPPPPPPFLPAPSQEAALPAPSREAALPAPSGPSATPAAPPASRTAVPVRTGVRPAPPSRARPATVPPPVTVTGRYRVVDSFDDGFIGEVLVVNRTDRDRDWTVRLRFPGNVRDLRTSWVESAPQATAGTDGGTFVWASGVPVAAGSSVALRFHFSRSGSGDRPRTCTVNGSACG
jgi:hypothetical protein